MFSEKKQFDLSKLSNEELLGKYAHEQGVARQCLGQRKYAGLMEFMNADPRDCNAADLAEASQWGVETQFAALGKLRAEIDKRGLQAPTMEEQDKKGP